MCLITNQEPVIINQDINVYKILIPAENNCYISPIMGFTYEVNKMYKSEISETREDAAFDEISLSFACFYKKLKLKPLKYYAKGFHSAICKERLQTEVCGGEKIVECVIPKESKIIFDNTGLIISNAIIIVKEYEEK